MDGYTSLVTASSPSTYNTTTSTTTTAISATTTATTLRATATTTTTTTTNDHTLQRPGARDASPGMFFYVLGESFSFLHFFLILTIVFLYV